MTDYVLDTSVFIAAEQQGTHGEPPEGDARVSVATLIELGLGERRARGGQSHDVRAATLERARRFIALPFDEAVAERLADILAEARRQGRRAKAMDAIVAATAVTHDLTVWTQDSDFDVLADLSPSLRVHRG